MAGEEQAQGCLGEQRADPAPAFLLPQEGLFQTRKACLVPFVQSEG